MRPRLNPRGWFLAVLPLFFQVLSQAESIRAPYGCVDEDLQFAGMSCTDEDSCPIYLELSSVEPDGKKIFAAGNLHSTSATLSSILLVSEDNGVTWKEPTPRIRGAALDGVQFYSLQAGWAAGETQYPLPRDPFFLITADGGLNWRRVPVGEEGNPGSIQRFHFDSERHGELVVDAGKTSVAGRYVNYETETGGGNWDVRAKSDRLAAARIDNSDWRARSSKDGKTYEIEQRVGGKWTSVASFLIEVANCKTKPEEPAEPETQK